ncbi:MAG: hypothetical protein O9262_03720 [Cyclobacteriaceae bacterium]|nr:hypothetical protein [Cyclobacteriaceae bacterium]
MKILTLYNFKNLLLTTVLFYFVQIHVNAQSRETIYKHQRLGKGRDRYNCLIQASDSVKIPEGIINWSFPVRTMHYQNHTYTFTYNKAAKQDELFKDDTTSLGFATSFLQSQAYQFTTSAGMKMSILRDSKTNSWSVVSDSTILVQGFYTKENEVRKFRMVEVDTSVAGTDIALLVSFAYSAQFIQNKVNNPAQTGTILAVVFMGALLRAAQ